MTNVVVNLSVMCELFLYPENRSLFWGQQNINFFQQTTGDYQLWSGGEACWWTTSTRSDTKSFLDAIFETAIVNKVTTIRRYVEE